MRLIAVVLLCSVAGLAQHGRAVRAGGGPQVTPGPKTRTEAGPKAKPTADVPKRAGAGTDVLAHIQKQPNLVTRLQPLLPQGVPVETAAAGFKNTGQFIAALHVSKNLGIPFADLKTQMTGPEPKPLGECVRTLKPDLSPAEVKKEVERAKRQAREDERESRNLKP